MKCAGEGTRAGAGRAGSPPVEGPGALCHLMERPGALHIAEGPGAAAAPRTRPGGEELEAETKDPPNGPGALSVEGPGALCDLVEGPGALHIAEGPGADPQPT